jgi:hypothetical protein
MTPSFVASDHAKAAALLLADLARPSSPLIRDLHISFAHCAADVLDFLDFNNSVFHHRVLQTLHLDGCNFVSTEGKAIVQTRDDRPTDDGNRPWTVHNHNLDNDVLNESHVYDIFGSVLSASLPSVHPEIDRWWPGRSLLHEVYTQTVETHKPALSSALSYVEFFNVSVVAEECTAIRRMLQRGVHLESLSFIDVKMNRGPTRLLRACWPYVSTLPEWRVHHPV